MKTNGGTAAQRRGEEEEEEIKIKRKQFKDIADMNNGSRYALSSTKRRGTERAHDLTFSKSGNVFF